MQYIILIQTIIAAVKAIETLMPESTGREKLQAAIATTEGIMGSLATSLPAIEAFVAVVVAGLNASGAFRKKA